MQVLFRMFVWYAASAKQLSLQNAKAQLIESAIKDEITGAKNLVAKIFWALLN